MRVFTVVARNFFRRAMGPGGLPGAWGGAGGGSKQQLLSTWQHQIHWIRSVPVCLCCRKTDSAPTYQCQKNLIPSVTLRFCASFFRWEGMGGGASVLVAPSDYASAGIRYRHTWFGRSRRGSPWRWRRASAGSSRTRRWWRTSPRSLSATTEGYSF